MQNSILNVTDGFLLFTVVSTILHSYLAMILFF